MNSKLKVDKKIEVTYIVSIVMVSVLILCSFIYSLTIDFMAIRPAYIKDISVDIGAMIVCGILIYSLAHDKPWDEQNRALFRLIFALCLLFHLDAASSFMEGNPTAASGVFFANTLSFFNETLLIYCFWVYIRVELKLEKKSIPYINYFCKSVLFIDLFLDLLNIKYKFFFDVSPSAEYIPGKYESATEITTFLIYLVIWYVILKEKNIGFREKSILLSFQILPMIAHIAGVTNENYSAVLPTYLFSVMLIYINVFSVRGKKILEQEMELNKQRATLMISQIQPHFLYNVLTTISNLCVTDPEEAEETTVLFSQYLRTNLDSLRKVEPVPFKTELGHIQTYVELEKKRFKDKLNIEIDCPETSFLVPALGLQPIVENSVKHGIRGKDTPGHLKITSYKVEGGVEVVIEDDGVGFDMNAPLPEDGKSHVGMVNVRSRLEQMCNAQMSVVSSPGNGCRTVVFFPDIPDSE